jgi:hypothetical protein
VRQQLRSLEPQGVGLRRKFATERDLGLQQSLVSLHPKTPTGYRCGKCEHRKYSYSGTGDIQRPAQLTHIFAAQLVFADPSNGGRKVKYSLAKLRVAQCQIVATARPAQIDIQRLPVEAPAQLFAERRRNSPVEVAGLAVPGKFAARECDQDPVGRAILDPPQSFLLAPVRARPFRAGEQHQPFRATEMVDDFPPEVRVCGESGCVTKDVDGPQREQRFGELFHSRFESLGQLVIGTMIIGNKCVVLDLHRIPRNTEVIETKPTTSEQSMSLTKQSCHECQLRKSHLCVRYRGVNSANPSVACRTGRVRANTPMPSRPPSSLVLPSIVFISYCGNASTGSAVVSTPRPSAGLI